MRGTRRFWPTMVGFLIVAAGLPLGAPAVVRADSTAQSLPFGQDWTNIGLITANDDWSGVPGVTGFLGQDITTGTGADPQTLLTDSAAVNDIDVIANQANPNTLGTGGVAEFHVSDPVVALNGSGTADAPHIVLTLDTTGASSVAVAYNLRDLDGSVDNSVQQVALQVRVGSSGSWTNIPAGYVADATTGPSQATLVTPVSAGLPASANNQPTVQVRVITSNAVGNDEWVGVDDISITAEAPPDVAPEVASTNPADGAVNIPVASNITVMFSEPVEVTDPWFTISCATSGSHTATASGGSTTYDLNPDADFVEGETCTVTIAAAGVADEDGIPTAMEADYDFEFTTEGGPPPLPFTQDWTDTGLITANDDWSGVPGIVGYLGDDASGTDVDPQTRLAGALSTTVDVIANQLNPNTLASGGVAEFQISNPVVALQGSGTADGPNIVISVSTTDAPGVNVAYNLRDIDGSIDNATQQVALQYRVGDSGAFTNVPAGYVADASGGPSLATQVTPVSVALPADAADEPLVQIRIITSNAIGSDEWVGVDDISITAGVPPDAAPTVTSTTPANGTPNVPVGSNIGVTFSEPVDVTAPWFTISCATSGSHTATVSGGTMTYTLDPDADFAESETCTVTIAANGVGDQDTDDPPNNMAADFTWTFVTFDPAFCTTPFTHTYQIQGPGNEAAMTGNQTTQGIVVADFEGGSGLSGFYLQDSTGDGDAATSDGIFIFTGSANAVSAGQLVRVTGFAAERSGETAMTGNAAGAPVTNIVDCGTSGSLTPTDVSLPLADQTFLERYEGMLVRLPQALVISEYFNYERFGELVLALPLPGETRAFTPTSVDEPGPPALARADANSLRRITLDDGLSLQNPDFVRHPNGAAFSLSNRFRGGDTVANTIGVLSGAFAYKIQPTAPATHTVVNARTASPQAVGGRLRVSAMNTLNFFITPDYPNSPADPRDNKCGPAQDVECRGHDADQPDEFTRQRAKLLAALAGLNADVIGLNEIENTRGVDPLGDPTNGIVAGLNAMLGAGTYAYINTGVIGTDAIRVGLIYRPAKVQPVGAFQILDSTDDLRFIDTKSRPVLAQTFEELATGERFTIAVNHLKSKGSDCNDVGDPDAGDGQGNCSGTRTLAAQALVDWLATDPTGSGDPDFLVVGDLNSYAKEDPIDAVLRGSDDTAGTGDDYTNLIAHFQGRYAYSYVFDGQSGYLDHALSSATLTSQVTGAADWHINADEPDLLDFDTSFKPPAQEAIYEPNAYRSSDHDPVVVGLQLASGTGKVSGSGTFAGGSFDISVQYRSNSTAPSGSASFSVTSEGASLTATTFDWLVVSGPRATFAGTGQLNGESGYGFLVSVVDGGSPGAGKDRIHVVAWEIGGDNVVDHTAILTSGNVTVHKPK